MMGFDEPVRAVVLGARGVFASLSARVGSIGDNRLGGWYSYRASKAAQNIFIKALASEASIKWKGVICVALFQAQWTRRCLSFLLPELQRTTVLTRGDVWSPLQCG